MRLYFLLTVKCNCIVLHCRMDICSQLTSFDLSWCDNITSNIAWQHCWMNVHNSPLSASLSAAKLLTVVSLYCRMDAHHSLLSRPQLRAVATFYWCSEMWLHYSTCQFHPKLVQNLHYYRIWRTRWFGWSWNGAEMCTRKKMKNNLISLSLYKNIQLKIKNKKNRKLH